jgi:ribosome-interacting GTPase 1
VLDVLKPLVDLAILTNELEGFGIRLNKQPPRITVRKKENGGVSLFNRTRHGEAITNLQIMVTNSVPLVELDQNAIKAVLSEYRINNAQVSIHEPNATVDQFIDVVEGNRVYVPMVTVLNKIDAISIEELDLLYKIPNSVPISSQHMLNIDELMDTMWDKLNLCRMYVSLTCLNVKCRMLMYSYTRPRGKQPDYSAPVVLRRGKSTVHHFCDAIHKNIAPNFKHGKCTHQSITRVRHLIL